MAENYSDYVKKYGQALNKYFPTNLRQKFKFLKQLASFIYMRRAFFAVCFIAFFFAMVSISIINEKSTTLRGSQITYRTKDPRTDQEINEQGRIVALPEEEFRFNLENGQIYIRQGNNSYKIVENYLSKSSTTLSLYFNSGWYKLAADEVLVLNDQRNIQDSSDFVYDKNIIKQNQIIATQKNGKKSDISFQPIDEVEEFSVNVSPSWLGWQTQVNEPIDVKNYAMPIINEDLLFVPTTGNTLVVLDSVTGEKKWEMSFKDRILLIDPDETNDQVAVTVDDKTLIFDAHSGQKIEEKNYIAGASFPKTPFVVDKNSHFKIEKTPTQILLTKTDDLGKTIWQYPSRDTRYFPRYFKIYGNYLVGIGGYGGTHMEDVPYKSSVYVLNVHTGRLITVKDDLEYANFDVIEDTLLIYDQTLQAYDLITGKLLWTSTVKDESGSNYKNWIVDPTNQIIYAADSDEVVALKKNGSLLWSKKIESTSRKLAIKNSILIFQGNATFYAFDLMTGDTLWQIDASREPHITNQNQVLYKKIETFKSQFTQTELLTLDPIKKIPVKILDHITESDNDIHFEYEDRYIYVFTNDFVTAIKYIPD